MIAKEVGPIHYSSLGELLMLELTGTANGENSPEHLPEEQVENRIPAVELLQKKLDMEPQLDPEASKAITQFIDHYRNKIILSGAEFKSHIPNNEIANRNVRALQEDVPPGPYESVSVGQDKHRILRIIHSRNNPQEMQILLKREYCVAQKNERQGLEHNGTTKNDDATKQRDISLWSSAKYFDQLTHIDVVTDELIFADDGDEVISLSEFDKRVLSEEEDAITDGELIAAVAVQKYKNEMANKPLTNGEVKKYLGDYLKKIVSLPYNGGNQWYEIKDNDDEMLAETQQYVATTTNEAVSIIVFTNSGVPRIQLQYERSPAQYYCRVLVAAGGGKELNQDTAGAAVAEAEAEVGAYSDKKQIIKLGSKYYRSDLVSASSQAYILINPEVHPGEFHGDELFRPIPQTFSIEEVKQLIANGLIPDVGTVVAAYKALLKLEQDGMLPPENLPDQELIDQDLIDPEHKVNGPQKMLDILGTVLGEERYQGIRGDKLAIISKEGLVDTSEASTGKVELTKAGELFASLMQGMSKRLLESATSIGEYKEMMRLFLAFIEVNASKNILELNEEQFKKLIETFAEMAGQTIDLFKYTRTPDFKEIHTDEVKKKREFGRDNASKSGSRLAYKVIQILDPTKSESDAKGFVKAFSDGGTIQELYSLATEVLGFNNLVFPEKNLATIQNFIDKKIHTQQLSEIDHFKLRALVKRSQGTQTDALFNQTDKNQYAVLEGVHLSWAAARGLFDRDKLSAEQYTPLSALIVRKYKNTVEKLMAESKTETPSYEQREEAIMVAVIELMKDLIYLEV